MGTECLNTTVVDRRLSGDDPFGVYYKSFAQEKYFEFDKWGSYYVIGFLGKKYFAGYAESLSPIENLLYENSKDENSLFESQLEEILIDNENEITFNSSSSINLSNNYQITMKVDVASGDKLLIKLKKDGINIDNMLITPSSDPKLIKNSTYIYIKRTWVARTT